MGPDDIAALFYGEFHSTEYRRRFADRLRIDFPRVFVPASLPILRGLVAAGRELLRLHSTPPEGAISTGSETRRASIPRRPDEPVEMEYRIAPGYPIWRDGHVFINRDVPIAQISNDVWQHRIGGHQVCRKWLKDRRKRTLLPADISCYQRLCDALTATQHVTADVDRLIANAGGCSGDRGDHRWIA